jgi:hypothetical protein
LKQYFVEHLDGLVDRACDEETIIILAPVTAKNFSGMCFKDKRWGDLPSVPDHGGVVT